MIRYPLQGREAQCPICDLAFTSDSMCEMHKRYRAEGAKRGHEYKHAQCVDPSTIGMVVKVNPRGVPLWTKPVEEGNKWWGEPVARSETMTLTCLDCGIEWERPSQRGRPPRFCAKCKESKSNGN